MLLENASSSNATSVCQMLREIFLKISADIDSMVASCYSFHIVNFILVSSLRFVVLITNVLRRYSSAFIVDF